MTTHNLSRVFGPTLVGHSKPDPEPMQLINETQSQAAVRLILLFCDIVLILIIQLTTMDLLCGKCRARSACTGFSPEIFEGLLAFSGVVKLGWYYKFYSKCYLTSNSLSLTSTSSYIINFVLIKKILFNLLLTHSHTTKFWTRPKLKAFANDKLNVTKMIISVFDRVENIVGKGESACTSNFSFSHNVFKKLLSKRRQKVSLCANGLKEISGTSFLISISKQNLSDIKCLPPTFLFYSFINEE